ncbi:type II secretion system GspH family protein [bacterium]|nr:type II secretion system GspH family protein [bacterium]
MSNPISPITQPRQRRQKVAQGASPGYKHLFSLFSEPRQGRKITANNSFALPGAPYPGFTLLELLIVVAIVAILAMIAVFNLRLAIERSLRASDAANLHTIATALQSYVVDHNVFPPADREAGPFCSQNHKAVGNGPAAGGSWDGLPWALFEQGYITKWETLFCPKYLKLYAGDKTIRGGWPRFHNFRYAYNSSAVNTGSNMGGAGDIQSGQVWLVRDLFVSAADGWYGSKFPNPPADYRYPWGEKQDQEQALYVSSGVKLVKGGTDEDAKD